MSRILPIVISALAAVAPFAAAQSSELQLPTSVEAGTAFSVPTSGSGTGAVYIIGMNQVLKRDVQLGQPVSFAAGALHNAGRYLVIVSSGSSSQSGSLDVVPATKPADITFLAKPSRLQVGLRGGITGTAYVFDSYQNLITQPQKVSFELSNTSAPAQSRTVETRDGAAWTQMDSSSREGKASFVARIADVSSTRVIGQVPGDPCSLKMNAKASGNKIALETDPVRDCSGNPVPDGTVVTFTESYPGAESVVDVPLKRGVAKVELPAHSGATISVASGVVLGNQIRWEK